MEMGGVAWRVEEYALTLVAMAVGFLVLAYLYAPYWKVRHVPGPLPLPLIGHLHLLAMHGPGVFSALAKRHGPIFRFHMGRQPLIIVADAELCREAGIKKFKSFPNRSMPAAITNSPIHQKGLFFSRDSRWSAMRNLIISIYQPSHLASLIPTMSTYIERAARNLGDGEEVTFSKLALSLSTDVIGQAAFGVDFALSGKPDNQKEDGVAPRVSKEFVNMHVYATTSLKMDLSGSLSIVVGKLVPFLHQPFRQLLKRVPGAADRKIDHVNRELSAQMDVIVADLLAARKRGSSTSTSTQQPKPKDLLSVVLAAREQGGTAAEELLTPDYISALTYEHLLAGSATTSFTLSTVIYLVAKHPEVEKKVLEEIDAFHPCDGVPTADDLTTRFPYLDQVLKESMRFYMVSPLVAREASEKVELAGYVLPKGTWVWLALGVLAKDPINFLEPELFRPERFNPANDEEKRRHPYAFNPFGIGPRACIGQKFAIQEIKLCMIHLYRHYVFRHSPAMESPLEFQYGIVLNFKHGVKVQVIKRHKD